MDPHGAVLMVISDVAAHGVEATLKMADTVCSRARPGSVIVQQRDSELPDQRRLELARQLRTITGCHGQGLSINERVDLALLVNADGVHLPGRGPTPERIRTFLAERGARLWVSAAHHLGSPPPTEVDAWVVAPVFGARKGRPAMGLQMLRELVAGAGTCRVFALGGVEPETAPECVAAGAQVAAIGAAYRDPDGLLRALAIER